MNTINVGIIGAGRIGKLHAENINKHIPQMQVKSISDPYLDFEWANTQNIPLKEKSHHKIFSDPEIDAVIICSPTSTHSQFIIDAAKAGKHIFCEKPIALDVATIEKSIEVVSQMEVILQIGFNRRFDPNFMQARKRVLAGDIGRPYLVRITAYDPEPPCYEYIADSGGIFLDMSIHDFDMARFLIDSEIEEVYATGSRLIDPKFEEHNDFDTAIIQLKFKNGALGVIYNSRQAIYGYDQRVEVFGSQGSIETANIAPTRTVLTNTECVSSDKPLYFFLERYKTSYIEEMKSFYECIVNNTPSPVDGNDGLMAVIAGLHAKQSSQENKIYRIDQFEKKYPTASRGVFF